jgi:pimeloyl-ACP methyl ester carboxylesterase
MVCAAAAAEETSRLQGRPGEPALLVRHEAGPGPAVVLVHGNTFPSALSFAYRIDGRSWMDDLRARGFDVWAFDFAGYGGSDRPKTMDEHGAAPGATPDAAAQIGRVADHVLRTSGRRRLSIVAHSWGTLPAGMFASLRPHQVDRLVLFGPVARRDGGTPPEAPGAGATLSTQTSQWASFRAGVPDGADPPFPRDLFVSWARDYLATDPGSASRTPPAVRVPSGPQYDVMRAWTGHFPYEPARLRRPTLLVRGGWDAVTTDADIAPLKRAFARVPGGARTLELPGGTHRMHLETSRQLLFDAVGKFLTPPAGQN